MSRRFLTREDGAATIEFVVVFLVFIAIIFFVMETALYMFFTASLEKAAQAGVRAAVVSGPLVAGLPPEIVKTKNGIYGRKCSEQTSGVSTHCIPFATQRCGAAPLTACLEPGFTRILDHMRGFNANIQAAYVTVVYQDIGLGFAGGPTTPMVTVTISGVPFQTGIVGLLLTNANVLAALPERSASMTGEDLAL
ncbi:MAG: TadE/TadG family type IV pilus assembly protein [Amphiplicatus sp.]